MEEKIYLLKIELLDVKPTIWRKFVVPASITMDRLHDVIQIIMGWDNTSSYDFIVKNKSYTEYLEFSEDGLDSGEHRLNDLVKKKNDKFKYLYDFEDGWEHEITVENVNYTESDVILMCIEGEKACPPENIGGASGYMHFSEVMTDSENEEYDEFMDWYGEEFDPEYLNMDIINFDLSRYFRWARYRPLEWFKN